MQPPDGVLRSNSGLKRAAHFLAIAALLGAALWPLQHPGGWRALRLVLAGKSPHCSWPNALHAPLHSEMIRNAKDRILAASRLVQREDKGFEQWRTPLGPYWISAGNQYLLPFNLAEQELDIYRHPVVSVQPGDIVLDCGASVGGFTREALSAGAKLVVAIEPAPINLVCLRRNLADEIASGRVIVYPKGVWDRNDILTLRVDPANAAAASFVMGTAEWEQAMEVPLTTIDHLVDELGLPRVDFIKMDIEGAETNAIHGASGTLRRWRPRLAIASYHLPGDPTNIPAAVQEAKPGYQQGCGPCEALENLIRPLVLFFW